MPNNQKSIKYNFIMNVVLTLSNLFFPIISFPYVSRVLTPAGNGRVSTALSVIAFFNIFAQLGIPTYGVKACAKVRDNHEELTRTAHELLMINLIMSIVMYILLVITILFLPVLRDEKTLYVIVSSTIFLTSLGMEWLYKALEQYTYITIRSMIFKFLALGLMFLLVHSENDYAIYGFVSIFASSASNILNLINVRKYIDIKPVGGYNFLRHLKPVGVFFAMACATTVYTNLDRVMIRFMIDDIETGLYDAAVKIKSILLGLVTSLGAVLLPRVSYYIENNRREEFRGVIAKAFNFVFVFASAVTVYFAIMARPSILLLSGDMYVGAIEPMRIIIPTVLLIGISNILGIQMLVPLGREKEVLFAEIGGAILDVIINLLLIQRFLSSGAAIGTLAAEIFVTTYMLIILRKELKGLIDKINATKILAALSIATALMLVSLYSTRTFIHYDMNSSIGTLNDLIGNVRWINELNSLIELMITFAVFVVAYIVFLLVLKEKTITETIGKLAKNRQK